MTTANAPWVHSVLDFWFTEITQKDWFISSDTLDATIKKRFEAVHAEVAQLSKLPDTADGQWAVAAVIVLDQFSRNIYRGHKNAFAFDKLALNFSKQALASQLDAGLSDQKKQFLYMPYMHSEEMDDQVKAVSLFNALGLGEHAEEHMAIVKQFNRFPHRNDVLERESTALEIEYLKNAKRFGQ